MSELVSPPPNYGRSRTASNPVAVSMTTGYTGIPFDSEKLPPSLISRVRRFLRVANQIEHESPRVAYLCRFHAFEQTHAIDPHSTGRGVRQFKTKLLQRLELDEKVTRLWRKENNDSRELKTLYQKYKTFILKHEQASDSVSREQITNDLEVASALADVFKTVISGVESEVLSDGEDMEENSAAFNILPLRLSGGRHVIMQFPEIKAAVAAICDIRGLPAAETNQKPGTTLDMLDWLQFWFGFQKGNVDNEREHMILLLANMHIRQISNSAFTSELDEGVIDELMKKLLRNYKNWCKYLGRKPNLCLPFMKHEARQYKLLYISLYLLIWGEASNLRFMPECLCYIFHNMAQELYNVLSGAVSVLTGGKVVPAYGRELDSFLKNVITPIYNVIYKESQKNKNGNTDHSKWRNYDDLNEYFWSANCFQLGWPLKLDHGFFSVTSSQDCHGVSAWEGNVNQNTYTTGSKPKWLDIINPFKILPFTLLCRSSLSQILTRYCFVTSIKDNDMETGIGDDQRSKWLGKANFVEIRSFWHLFRSFDRMWIVFLLALQVMIISAWHDMGSPFQIFNTEVFEATMSIFITYAVLTFIKATLDIAFIWRARATMNFSQSLRYALKLVAAATWTIVLPAYYAKSTRTSACSPQLYQSGGQERCISSYMVVVGVYLMNDALGMVLFLVPAIGSCIETSDSYVCRVLSWWAHPRQFVGRGIQEHQIPLFRYILFWALLLFSKFSFSYHFEIKPLVQPTKLIMKIGINKYDWHEFFPKVKSNAGAIVAIWAPVILVYFVDTQIWYSVFCTIVGGVYGLFNHLGEIYTVGMLRSRFESLPAALSVSLLPDSSGERSWRNLVQIFQHKICKASVNDKTVAAKFAQMWNQIITTFRSEDLISNREMDLLIIPVSSALGSGFISWPVFLLANKLSTAVNIAQNFVGKDEHLYKKIRRDSYMYYAVKECYQSIKYILDILVVGELEKRIISELFCEIETSFNKSRLLLDFKTSELPFICDKCVQLAETLLENQSSGKDTVVRLLQDIFEVVTKDVMVDDSRIFDVISFCQTPVEDAATLFEMPVLELFASNSSSPCILFPLPDSRLLKEQIKRLFLLLTVKETATDIPKNLEARRRITFFATSLFMDMPSAPSVRNMLSFSVLTPYYMEEVTFSQEELNSCQDGASLLFYMQEIYPDEWRNFLERMECKQQEDFSVTGQRNIQDWASFRGQTLSRTVRGMMYYRKALKLQAFLDMAAHEEILEDYNGIEMETDRRNSSHSLSAQLAALVDMKFTHIISCQMFGAQKAAGAPRALGILDLMIKYPSLRVAYIEEKDEIGIDRPHKVYSSILVKAVNKLDQEVYRIKLPGSPTIGEGKPENQNQAIIFTRGDALQAIDMNQDGYLEEAFKMRNILQEFVRQRGGRPPTILGIREHIFTGSISSLANFMSYQETSFATIGQRLLANPLRARFHYGHSDVFDRLFHITRGGISKASKTINLSEDVFAGFNSTLRRGFVTYHEYMQVGKGRDVGLNQISKFEAKVANGNGEQTLSRDIYRLGHQFDFFRMLSCYFTTVGFYFSSLIVVVGVYIFLYGQLYLILSGVEKALLAQTRRENIQSLETALASQSFIQLGLLTGLPMVVEIGLEKGFRIALTDFVLMQLQLAAVFFTFSLGTKSHHYGRTILHGGAKYQPTERKFVVFHASFTENYRQYSRSHFVKGFELILLLVVHNLFKRFYQNGVAYVMVTYSIWFMSGTWIFAPFLFNPSGFRWQKIVEDWQDWNKWIKNEQGIGVHQDRSWESWWNDEQIHLAHTGWGAKIIEVLLSLRFFIYQYGLVYHLDIVSESKSFLVYLLSWAVIGAILLLLKVLSEGRQRLSADFHILYRLFKAVLFLGVVSIIVSLFVICKLSVLDLFICCLAFLPTGWGLLLIAQAVRAKIEHWEIWDYVQVLAQAYDYGMGILLFAPIAALAWLPVISACQTRFLFNEAFNRHLHIQPILSGKRKQK